MAEPTFLIGPTLAVLKRLRKLHQYRRKVKLTVHRAYQTFAMMSQGNTTIEAGAECYFVTITNASKDRDIEVTHLWFDTEPPAHIVDHELPVRLKYSERWETFIEVDKVNAPEEEALWLARCLLSPDDKVIKSRPRENVPPFGTVPRKSR